MDFKWTLISQFSIIVVDVITVITNYLTCRNNNRNTQKLELIKQEFARENDKIKRDQSIKDKQQALIIDFLNATFDFSVSKTEENKSKVIKSCNQLLIELNKDKNITGSIKGLINNIKKYDLEQKDKADEEKIDRLIKSTITKLINIKRNYK